ncbi:hypothetical protein BCV70DRAFT_199721 [Testicularia cyperi]|uniref:C4-dicarboxylate transporter/malic acid transport protein n=1 Tax=Testicularia cyperi TaxID=1882483 RepID=A0A317XQ01_9BASI|nr:hypothetical protein BCV70DRAFT_199721 [Testicularia cyperi]
MSNSRQEVYQDAPGLEPQNDVDDLFHHTHHQATGTFSGKHAPASASAPTTAPGSDDDVEAALASQADPTVEPGHEMQDAESYGQRLTRVLTGQETSAATQSSSSNTDASAESNQRENELPSAGSKSSRSRGGLLHLSRRRKPRSGVDRSSSDASKSGKKAKSKKNFRQKADELARMADSEKHVQADRIRMTGDDGKPMRRHGIKERVLHFTPSWFSVTMGTGAIATLLNLLPWPSIHNGLRYPALVFLFGDIVLFIVFLAAFLARYAMYPEVLPLTFKHPQKSMFLGTLPMGLIVIISGIAQLGTHEFKLGIGFALAASGLWWLATFISLLTAIGIPFSMMTYQKHYFEGITAALLLPIVPPITAAATGSVLSELLYERYPTYSFTILVVSYMVLGIGLPLALLIQVLYFQRLLLFNSPPRDVIISVFLPLGPCGQGGEACLHLGKVALGLFPAVSTRDGSGVRQLISVGEALYGAGLISALLLWGLGIWWLFIGLLTIARELRNGKLGFNMGWWGATFPTASLAICTARLAIELDSLALKIVYTVFTIANILLWLAVAIPTAKGAWTGRLFNAPCLADLPLKP